MERAENNNADEQRETDVEEETKVQEEDEDPCHTKVLIHYLRKAGKQLRAEPYFFGFLVLIVVIALLVAQFGYWNYLEPVIAFLTLAFAGWAWWQTRRVELAKFKKSKGRHIVAVEIGRPVSEAIKNHFGDPDDSQNPYEFTVIEVESLLGKTKLEHGEDYRRTARRVYREIARNQHKEIHLVLSGPVGLSFIIGQMVGLHHFNITVYQFDPETGYISLPKPQRDWLGFRGEG